MAKRKTILLLNPPGQKMYSRDNYCSPESKAGYYWQPIDLLVQSGHLKSAFEVEVLDAIIENKTDEDVLDLVSKGNYYSILSLTGTASWQEDFNLLGKIKVIKPEIILALTGNLALFEHRELFKNYGWLDVALLDYTTDDYGKFLQGERDSLNKIVYRNAKNAVTVVDRKTDREFSYPFPLHEKFKNHLYHLPFAVNHPSTAVLGSAGCPQKCEFCVASEIKYRFRNTDNLIAELKGLYEMGIKEVGFIDFMFEVNRNRAMEICDRMISERIKLTWACCTRVDTLDESLLRRMKDAGCHTVQMGIESSLDSVLKAQKKNASVERTKMTIGLCNKVGIRAFGYFIIGLPGESEESLWSLGKYARQIGCTNAVFSTLVPDVGTVLRKKVIEEGKIENQMTKFSSTDKIFPHSLSGISNDKLAAIRRKVMLEFYFHPTFIYKNFIRARSFYEFRRKVGYGLQVLRRI